MLRKVRIRDPPPTCIDTRRSSCWSVKGGPRIRQRYKDCAMNRSTTIETIQSRLSYREAECAAVRARYKELRAVCAELEDVLGMLLADAEQPAAVRDDSLMEADVTPAAPEPAAAPSSGYPLDIDISNATNHVERVRLLALHTEHHEVNVYQAARWLTEVGASNAAEGSLISTLYGKLKQLDYFRKVRPAVYRYIPLDEDETFLRVDGDHQAGELIQFGAKVQPEWTTQRS